ncbi:MAG: nicotinate-nucleotide adenylyltransferase [Planctomycetaceae bacterium]|nr:nicotinate-nucleotide adenylyltransferase [Planctomycetaceae bacterium]
MRLGIFGGSFNPVHYGHLVLAEVCRETCGLDEVWLVPAAVPPHKQGVEMASGKARLEMLELALAGNEHLRPSPVELDRGGVSYTVDTLACIAEEKPGASLFLLMGADSLEDLPTWREPERICALATPIVVRRAGSPEPDFSALAPLVSAERLAEIRRWQVEMPLVELSSTDLRQRAAAGKSLRFRTPRAVERYIETHGLYRVSGEW